MTEEERISEGQEERVFKGVWIPAELYLAKGLSMLEKVLFVEINSLNGEGGCFASNDHFSEHLNVGRTRVSQMISKLKGLNLVEEESFDGRRRVLRSCYENLDSLKSALKETKVCLKGNYKADLKETKVSFKRNFKHKKNDKENDKENDNTFRTSKDVLKDVSEETPRILNRRTSETTPQVVISGRVIPTFLESFGEEALSILKFWNSLGKPLTVHKIDPDSKTAIRALKVVRKQLGSDTVEVIKASIRQYHEVLSSSNTCIATGIPGHKVGLDEFFGFNGHTRERIHKQRVPLDIKSWYFECLPSKDPVAKYINPKLRIPDVHPKVTAKFKKFFVEKVLGGVRPSFKEYDETQFRRAAMRAVEFLEENKRKLLLDPAEKRNPVLFVNHIFAALEAQLNGNLSTVTPGWFSSDILYQRTLPAYLYQQAMIEEGER